MRNDNSSTNPYSGYLMDLIQKISDELKFQFELYEVPDQQFGAVDDNGEWNGLIRELIDKVNANLRSFSYYFYIQQ